MFFSFANSRLAVQSDGTYLPRIMRDTCIVKLYFHNQFGIIQLVHITRESIYAIKVTCDFIYSKEIIYHNEKNTSIIDITDIRFNIITIISMYRVRIA